MIWQGDTGPVYAVGKHFVQEFINHPPPDATLEALVTARANLLAIEEVDALLEKLSNIPK